MSFASFQLVGAQSAITNCLNQPNGNGVSACSWEQLSFIAFVDYVPGSGITLDQKIKALREIIQRASSLLNTYLSLSNSTNTATSTVKVLIKNFTANPSALLGQSATSTLKWETTGAKSCVLNIESDKNIGVAVNGSFVTVPTKTTRYFIKCFGESGTEDTKYTTVSVSANTTSSAPTSFEVFPSKYTIVQGEPVSFDLKLINPNPSGMCFYKYPEGGEGISINIENKDGMTIGKGKLDFGPNILNKTTTFDFWCLDLKQKEIHVKKTITVTPLVVPPTKLEVTPSKTIVSRNDSFFFDLKVTNPNPGSSCFYKYPEGGEGISINISSENGASIGKGKLDFGPNTLTKTTEFDFWCYDLKQKEVHVKKTIIRK